ncbi:TonB-dependent receptor [Caulobacter sp. DWR2-3-1b2]|uniref:TonB-dependent receptor n=1 Tax=Caulobacter sp. DWR2-3-1b2 TaxID=2804642 RepID=UPI003CF22A85
MHLIHSATTRDQNQKILALKYGVSAIALSAMLIGAPALAQTQTQAKPASDAQIVDEVVVTSIRKSLQSSQQLKQSSEIIGDSITSEDIGALPDRSVTEALQRIPGVAISRFAAGVDPDHFSAEGSGVVVRGLNFVRSELNGRDTFSANNGRALSFADVPSELMGGVDVFKSPSADMIEGGISGTVNLRTRLPFDSSKRLLSVSAEESYGDFVKKWAPTFSALYSDQWDTEAGTFGLLLSAVDSKLSTRSDGTQVSNFGCRTGFTSAQTANPQAATCPGGGKGVWFPRGAAFRSTETKRERTGYAAAGQWRSNDDTMLATFQYLRSESTQSWTEHAIEIATDNVTSNGDSRPIDGTTFGVDSNGVFTNGVITGPQGWRDDQFSADPRVPSFGLQSNNVNRNVEQTYLTSDYGFNFKWTPNDRLGVAFDYQHVDSTVDNLDVGIWGSSFQNLNLKLNGSDLPEFTFIPPASGASIPPCSPPSGTCSTYFNAPNDNFQSPHNSFWRSAMDHIEQSEGKEDAAKIDVDYRFAENSWLESARVGVRWAERDQTTRFSTYNWGVLSEIWGGGGPVWFDDQINGSPTTPGGSTSAAQTTLYPFTDFMRGQVPVPTGLQARPFYNGNSAKDYAAMTAFALSVGDEWRARNGGNGCPQNWVPLAQRCGVVAGTPFLPGEINPINEKTQSAYGMLRFRHEFDGDIGVSGNIGLRYTKTKREASGFLSFPASNPPSDQSCLDSLARYNAQPNPKPAFAPTDFCSLPATTRAATRLFSNGATTPTVARATFEHWLPSVNVKVALPNKVQLRFAASKTITPPDIGLTRNYYNVGLDLSDTGIAGPPLTATSVSGNLTVGNPYLKPTKSFNLDGAVEWYFAPVGSLTFAAFYKELKDVATNSTARIPFTNNGATFDVAITTPGNSDQTAKVKGFEIGYQQFYDFLPKPFDGFGINANYTYIDSKGVPQSTLSATDPDVAAGRVSTVDTSLLPLQGLSKHNVNFAGIYEKGPISARLAYNWRSDFLLTVRDVIVPYAPIMNEATGQLDGSLFYTVNPKVKIGVQGVNLTNEVTKTTQVLNNQLLKAGRSWFMNDRRYTFVVRASF